MELGWRKSFERTNQNERVGVRQLTLDVFLARNKFLFREAEEEQVKLRTGWRPPLGLELELRRPCFRLASELPLAAEPERNCQLRSISNGAYKSSSAMISS